MSKKAELKRIETEVSRYLGGKWFAPILVRLGMLEMDNPKQFSDLGAALDDDAPEWRAECMLKGATSVTDTPFVLRPEEFGSREFAKFLGMKWAVISAFHAQHPIWKALTTEQIVKIEDALRKGCVAEMIAMTGEISRKQYRKMKVIKRRAEILAEEQSLIEQSEFHHGFASGLTFLRTLADKMKNPEGKRATDEQKRQLVYLFGAVHGDEIEKMKADLSWPEVAEGVAEMVDHKVEIEEDTVKKILQRTGLKGVGKPGRAPTN